MLGLIKKIISNTNELKTRHNNTAQDALIALCVLLLEAAHADGECSREEMEQVISTLMTEYNIPRQEIDELIASSRRERNDSVDLFRFTRYMNTSFSQEEKIAVMEAVWRVLLLDARLEAHEDHFAHKLANLLRLTQTELIDAKLKARKQLS